AAGWIAARYQPDAIYTSPLRRCIHTGAAIARACGRGAKILESLTDINYGSWQWKTPDEVHARWPALLRAWRETPELVRIPGGESLQDLAVRAADARRYVAEEHAGQTVILVTHDSAIRAMLLQLLDMGFQSYRRFTISPCGIGEILVDARHVTVQYLNATPS
ncbi:MAG TPA: histidine phosphatase family protein, partial [Verrucomicrobiae bacterium]|nr:histidine phosphatase family protein [Verrucomicrobiae bacterium]